MADTGGAPTGTARAITGAVLLDLAVSPLFAWDVFTDALGRDLAVGHALLAGVFSVGLVAFMVGVLAGGRAADTLPPRRLALVALTGTVLGLLGSAVAPTVLVLFLTFGVLVGGSTGLGYVTAVRVAGTVASGRGLALGLVVSAYAAGTAVLAPAASWLLDEVGRRATFVVLAGALGVLLVVAAVLVPGTSPISPRRHRRATRRGRPSGPVLALWVAFGLGSAPALAAFAQAGSLVGDATAVTLAVVSLNLGNFGGRLIAGPMSDRIGRRAALHVNSALLVLACLPLAAGATGSLALVALLLLGLQYGALSTLTPAATSDVVPAESFGTTYGMVFTGLGVAGLVAPVAAATLAVHIGYGAVYVVFLVIAALAWASVGTYARLAAGRE
ncbi:MFS transporter [Actinomycetospora cinnamomea]|uniref:Sugar phosphate permease n=1 Tax=Actinomycetospora cinnamomea TaxID=663609 RepID=A0A2U1EAJ1_9PSEU|nr:MFS transporter [Actinomycetospora cinnamomea]PVY96917.1 sugar phosphate permease [Actinomycetospora cinnamomea]